MQTLLIVVFFAGIAVMVVGSVMILVAAFRTSLLWGLAYFFIPFAACVYWFTHWDESSRGMKVMGIGFAAMFVFGGLAAAMAPSKPVEAVESAADKPAEPSRPIDVDAELARLKVRTEEPVAYAQPTAVESVAEVKPAKKFEQVWADTTARKYYPENCRRTPPNAYKVAKSVVKAQGFTEATCP
jgi:hypothetical protein